MSLRWHGDGVMLVPCICWHFNPEGFDLSPGSDSALTLRLQEGTVPGMGDVVPMLMSPLSTLRAGGERVPLDEVRKVAGRCHAGGESWQPGLPGLPMLWLVTNWE